MRCQTTVWMTVKLFFLMQPQPLLLPLQSRLPLFPLQPLQPMWHHAEGKDVQRK